MVTQPSARAGENAISSSAPLSEFVVTAERCYASLAASARACRLPGIGVEPGLGGALVYAGSFDAAGQAAMAAANVAGAAVLAVAEDPNAQRQAAREGVADFLVTSLDEALRILKNEIRKKTAVAVCVAAASDAMEREMAERGVLPDLVFAGAPEAKRDTIAWSGPVEHFEPAPPDPTRVLLQWRVAQTPARWMPKLDAFVLELLDPDAAAEQRWIRSAARCLGQPGKDVRALTCEPGVARQFLARVELAALRGEVGAPVKIEIAQRGSRDGFTFAPVPAPKP